MERGQDVVSEAQITALEQDWKEEEKMRNMNSVEASQRLKERARHQQREQHRRGASESKRAPPAGLQ